MMRNGARVIASSRSGATGARSTLAAGGRGASLAAMRSALVPGPLAGASPPAPCSKWIKADAMSVLV